MPNALLKGRWADLSGAEITPGGGGGGSISGSGTTNQVVYWSGTSSVAGDTGLTFDPSTNILTALGGYAFSDSTLQTTAAEQAFGWVTNTNTVATNGRYYKTSNAIVKLGDGRFFTAGGEVGTQTLSELINNTATASVASGTTTANRTAGVRLVLLTGGDVLVVGGNASPLTSETWNSGTGLFTARGACTHVEDGGIVALDNGNAVVFGGMNTGTPLATAQIYSASGHTFSATGTMVNARTAFGKSFHVPGGSNGKAFVAGGQLVSGDETATTEMYDGDAGTWSAKASMATARGDSCNVQLPGGNIMVAGGTNNFGNAILSSVEIYDPGANSWSTVGSLKYARQGAHGIALADGRVIVAGGIAQNHEDINLPTEIYDPNAHTWSVLTGPLNYTPTSPTDPLHAIYGAELALLNGVTGLAGVVAIGGKAAAPFTFPSTSLRDIRQLKVSSTASQIDARLLLKTAYDNQGSKPFIIGTDVFQSMAAAKTWFLQSPEPTFTNLFAVYADATAEPTNGSGVLVGGTTFHSAATKNIFDSGPTTFGSQTFSMASASLTIPSNKQIVRLISTIGDLVLSGTPTIAPGLFEGQRLITIIDSASTGNVQFTIGSGRGIQPISSPTTLQHYGFDYQEALEWVWVDGFWKTISTPAQNPITIPISSGGLTNWAEAFDNSGINASIAATSLTAINGTDSDAIIQAKGAGATLAQIPDGTSTGGDKRGGGATDFQKFRSTSFQVAAGLYSFIGAGLNNKATGDYDIVVGGDSNSTSGGGGQWGAIVGGQFNAISVAGGGNYDFVGGGSFNQVVGPASYASVLCGSNNTISGSWSTGLGGNSATDRGIDGKAVFGVGSNIGLFNPGIHQVGIHITRSVTNDNTVTGLTTDDSNVTTATNTNFVPDQGAYKVRAEVVAFQLTTGDSKAWTMECLVTNFGGIAIIGSPPAPVVVGDSGVGWTAVLAVDVTDSTVYVQVVGAAADTVHWTSTMYTTEVTA